MVMRRLITLAATLTMITVMTVLGSPTAAASKPIDVGPVSSGWVTECGDWGGTRGMTYVTLAGDYVTVRDRCRDGRGVKGMVTMRRNDLIYTYTCPNLNGYGTEVVCNFDWYEGFVGFKTIASYYRSSASSSSWTLGMIAHWRDG